MLYLLSRNIKRIAVKDDEVGVFAGDDGAFHMLLEIKEGRIDGHGLERVIHAHCLPTAAHHPILGSAGDCGTYLHQRINRQDGAVGMQALS